MATRLAPLVEPLRIQLGELRSSILKDTCTTVGVVAEALGDLFDDDACKLIPLLFESSGSKKKVIANSAVACMTAIVTHCRGGGTCLAAVMTQVSRDKSAQIRAHCMAVMAASVLTRSSALMLKWPHPINQGLTSQ